MESTSVEWWRRHGWTIGLLLVAFGIAFALRTVWQYPILQQFGSLYTYAGGSDSYYHSRVMTYIIQTHHNLVTDPLLHYPMGATNPREPLFDWMNAVLGILFAPFFGGNAVQAGAWMLNLQSPLWAALSVFPVYLIGREISGRRAGLVAALVYPFFPASIDSSTFGYADYLSFYAFFLLVVVYAYLRTLKAVGHRRWVDSYRDPKQYVPAIRGFLRTERSAVKWAVFTGVSLGAFALAWQGYTYAIVVIAFTVLIAMLIERIRRVDSFGLYVVTWIIGLIAFPMAAPYYLVQGIIRLFLELPVILFFGTLLLLLPFLMMRDVPWVFSIPALFAVVAAGVFALRFLTPALFTSAITGNGYFVKTLVYSTVAEAQAPSIDALIVGYGVITFFLAFIGLALFGYLLARQRFKRHHIAFVIFAVVSIYLPISAAKFFLVASPAFALLSAEAIQRLLDVGGYPQLRRSVASLTDRAGGLAAFRKSFRARHILVLALVVGIILPNIWISIDAGIPSNTKQALSVQINDTIPSWLKLNQSAPAADYLGAAGTGLDTSNQYDSAAYNWLAEQDTNVPQPDRPAYISWWDYGFQAIDQGQHPSVADNFQNGIDPAGQFLLSQNESLAIAILATTLLQGELAIDHGSLPSSLNALIARDGVDVTTLHTLLTDESADFNTVVAHPETYLPVNPTTLTLDNAMYLATSYYLASHLTLSGVANLYDGIEAYTGWSIRYAMTDSRLIPFTGSDTGIFYAPADLTGRVINSEGVPTTFYNVTILGSDGNTYPLGPLPAGVSASQYNINWTSAYYNSMVYRIYFGYNGTDVGVAGGGIPGLIGAAEGDPIEPGWMLQHFEVEYETAYACSGVKNASAGAPCMEAMNRPTAVAVANSTHGSDDLSAVSYFEGGESILAYYPGVTLYGRLILPNFQPVPGTRVTVYDDWGIPHMTNVTTANGTFTLVLPPGNDTIKFSYGTPNGLAQAGADVIGTVHVPVSSALGFSPSAPSMVESFTVGNGSASGQVFWNVSGNSTYDPSVDPVVAGAHVDLTNSVSGTMVSATSDASGTFDLPSVAPGVYNVRVVYQGRTYNESAANVSSYAGSSLSLGLSPGKVMGDVLGPTGVAYPDATVTLTNSTTGVSTSTTTNASGGYLFTGLAPGGYGVSAVGLDPVLTSGRVGLTIASGGKGEQVNLTLIEGGIAEVALAAGSSVLANATVTFTPMPAFGLPSTSPIGSLLSAATNTTLASTASSGIATTMLRVGTYSVAAQGRVGGTLYAAVGNLSIAAPGATAELALTLTPAESVLVSIPGGVPTGSRAAVVAFGPAGSAVLAWAGSNGTASLSLPSGSYSFLAVSGGTSATANASAALFAATISGPQRLAADLAPAVTARFVVGTAGASGGVLPAAGATVVLSIGAGLPAVSALTGTNGSVAFVVPSTPTGAAGGYCVRAAAFGFTSGSSCGFTSEGLESLGRFNLAVNPVPVTLTVVGLPVSTPVTVNFTGESVAASNVSLTGGPTFSLSLPPGLYGVGARAVIGHGTTVYLPSSILSTVIPIGATYSNLTLVVVAEINASGTLTVPSGLAKADVSIALASPVLNVTVNGSAYTKSFRAAPGTYTATVRGSIGTASYVNITRVTLYANGTILPRLVLSGRALMGKVEFQANGAPLSINTTAVLRTEGGLSVVATVTDGQASVSVRPGTYAVFANATTLTAGTNGSFYTRWTTGSSGTCSLAFPTGTSCNVSMTGTPLLVNLTGSLLPVGSTTPAPGALRLVGPYPSTNVTVIATTNGTFSVAVLPGAYYAYASATGGTPLASFGRVLALPTGQLHVTIPLYSAWNDRVSLSAASPSAVTGATANVTLRDVFGDVTTLAGVTVGGSVNVALPPGTYVLNASVPGTRNGVAGTATATARVAVVSGNGVTDLALAVPPQATVSAETSGPSSANVSAGGQTTFAFTVNASGNEPVTVRPVGAPSSWTFAFSFANATLAPGGRLSGEVRITVPAGTAVAHAPVTIDFLLPNGTVAGAISPSPVVNVLPYWGLSAGPLPGKTPSIGSTRAIVPFYLTDSGNTGEAVQLYLVNSVTLAAEGWTALWEGASGVSLAEGIASLSAGQNVTASVNLVSSSAAAIPPREVVVEAQVVGITGTIASTFSLSVPAARVATSPGTLLVTGPSVTSGPSAVPVWFLPAVVFLPAIGLVIGVLTYRWWRTRRWVRR